MYRVLVPLDTDEDRAKKQAEYVSRLPDTDGQVEAILLFVYHEGNEDERPESLTNPEQIKAVKEAKTALKDKGIEVTVLEDSGDPVDSIIDCAEKNDVESIVMGGRKRSPTGKALFGSITQSVILNSKRPVVVTGVTD